MRARRVDHAGFVVDDVEGLRDFLVERLGFEHDRTIERPGLTAVVLTLGDTELELLDVDGVEGVDDRDEDGLPRRHVAIEVEDLEAAIAELREAGAVTTAEQPSEAGPIRSYFTLPESTHGLALQVVQRV